LATFGVGLDRAYPMTLLSKVIHISFFPFCSDRLIGQTGSGKTRFVFQLLKTVKDIYVKDPPNEIMGVSNDTAE
jgi:hypothetical protein